MVDQIRGTQVVVATPAKSIDAERAIDRFEGMCSLGGPRSSRQNMHFISDRTPASCLPTLS
jgi:hypothetical protein